MQDVHEEFDIAVDGQQAIDGANDGFANSWDDINAPGEFAALFDYSPSFQKWIEEQAGTDPSLDQEEALREVTEALRAVDFDVTVDVETREVRIDDDRVKVVVDNALIEVHASGDFEGDTFQADLVINVRDGLCADASGTASINGEVESFDESGCAGDILPGADFDGVFLVTVERDGGWYFSPTETLVEYARLVIDSELAN